MYIVYYSVCTHTIHNIARQATFVPVAPLVDPAKLAAAAFVSALVLGLAGGILSTARLLAGSLRPSPQPQPQPSP